MDAETKAALLQDPKVQAALRAAGDDAMKDPKVQQALVEVCKDKYPEMVDAARSQMMKWANDPEVHQKMKETAARAVTATASAVVAAPGAVVGLIEQGAPGIRILAFNCGFASFSVALLNLILSPLGLLFDPLHWILSVYQLLFSIVTMLFEIHPDTAARFPVVVDYQARLMNNAKFLAKTWGRGMFYFFIGSLWLAQASWSRPLTIVVGVIMCIMGFVHVGMHFGVTPQMAVARVRKNAVEMKSVHREDVETGTSSQASTDTASGLHVTVK